MAAIDEIMDRRCKTGDESNTFVREVTDRRSVLRNVGIVALAGAVSGFGGFARSAAAHSAEPPEKRWTREFGGAETERAYDMIRTDDCGFALVGYTRSADPDASTRAWFVKTDSDGEKEWSLDYDWRFFESVLQVDDGYLVSGSKSGKQGGEAGVHKIDAEGKTEWSRTYGIGSGRVSAITELADGGVVGGGSLLLKLTQDGDKEWYRNRHVEDVVATDDGGVAYVSDSALMKSDSDGRVQLATWFHAGKPDKFSALTRTSDGGYALLGTVRIEQTEELKTRVVRTSARGEKLWETRFTPFGVHYDIIELSDGTFVAVGGRTRFQIVKLDSDGTLLWSKRYLETEKLNTAEAVVETEAGGLAVSGTSPTTEKEGSNNRQMVLIKTEEE